jgi:hypothetical protein
MTVVLEHFRDEEGGFFDTADDHELLVMRPKDLQDNALPSGNSMTVRILLMLAAYTGQVEFETPAIRAILALQGVMGRHAGAFTHWLGTLEFALAPPKEVAVIGTPTREDTVALLRVVQQPYRPNQVVACAAEDNTLSGHPALIKGRLQVGGKATVYVCQNFVCRQPVQSATEFEALLSGE